MNNTEQTMKIRKKPGRKPNPASPALRKAQNRAAQRAFRERKERHMRELEVAIKEIKEQRDKLHTENEHLKADSEILRSENWYLKGIVLTLQLVCFQHNLVIPQHGPYINEQALSLLAQSIPEPISTYISVNANNKAPIPTKLFGHRQTMRQRDRYLSTDSIVVTKEGVHNVSEHQIAPTLPVPPKPNTNEFAPSNSLYEEDYVHPLQSIPDNTSIPPLSPITDHETRDIPRPILLAQEPVTSNLAAIQTLRLRLRLQSSCTKLETVPYAIQPTLLQLIIPHDPRIDLVPTPHMRDRMILFRDQFDLDDCFRCILSGSVFHGGDPAVAANWELPAEFFGKYWFLTIDYDLRRTTNYWRRLQGLNDIDFKGTEQKKKDEESEQQKKQSVLERPPHLDYNDISALLGVHFEKIAAISHQQKEAASYASSLSSDCSTSSQTQSSPPPTHEEEDNSVSSFEPIQLTDGCSLSYLKKSQRKRSSIHHYHPYQHSENTINIEPPSKRHELRPEWNTLLRESMDEDYDLMMNNIIEPDKII
ncbi:hypothetical protein G6F37_004154 [Rhizopus arrhizus]|nr:hypothetical protein G6F38_001196 [Rhizopus arrhizus]KAG1160265.1 hypothetical protein G6F37_004154 [Rhizopus arrhizus]